MVNSASGDPTKPPDEDSCSIGATKPAGYTFYKNTLKKPRLVVAPMVDGSELAWRILSRSYGAELCYTPMIHAALFAEPKNVKYRQEQFDLESGEEGRPGLDRPLIAQFCANDPNTLLKASQLILNHPSPSNVHSPEILRQVDAIDLNLGCPQGIAKKGKYGAFLMDHLDLISQLVSHLHQHSPVPVTAKYRRFEDQERTDGYTERLIEAGAQILTLHGRTREQKGQFTGLADWKMIKSAVEVSHQRGIPIFGNGNILTSTDVEDLLSQTGADGVMTAEGNLYNPAIFAPLNQAFISSYREKLPQEFKDGFAKIERDYEDPEGLLGWPESLLEFPQATRVASEYLMICRTLQTRTATSAIKGHLHKLFRSIFSTGRYDDLREQLARISWSSQSAHPSHLELSSASLKRKDRWAYDAILDRFQQVVDLVKARLEDERQIGLLDERGLDVGLKREDGESTAEYLKRLQIPYSRCQPYLRVTTNEGLEKKEGLDLKTGPPESQDYETSVSLGPPPCSNPSGCQNSGAAKCRWKLCKSCCWEKTKGLGTPDLNPARDGGQTVLESLPEPADQDLDNASVCVVHLKRARLELEKRQFKAQRRKRAKLADSR